MKEKLFEESRKLLKEKNEIIEQYFKIDKKIIDLKERIINIKLEELGVNIGDKVIDAKLNKAFLVSIDFEQKPITWLKDFDEVTFDDFQFKGKYKIILKNGKCGKKDNIYLDINTLKRYEEA